MPLEKKVRCPYCQKVFVFRVKSVAEGQASVNARCPYCREKIVIKTTGLTGQAG